MNSLGVVLLILYFPALARLTKLVNDDMVTDPIRARLAAKFNKTHPMLVYFIECPWCVSVWLGAATAPLVTYATGWPWWMIAVIALAGSYVTGLASRLHPGDDLEEEHA